MKFLIPRSEYASVSKDAGAVSVIVNSLPEPLASNLDQFCFSIGGRPPVGKPSGRVLSGLGAVMSVHSPRRPILYVTGSLLVGGAEMHLSMVAPELVRRGYAVSVYNISGESVLGDGMARRGVEVIGPPAAATTDQPRLVRGLLFGLSSLKLFLVMLRRRQSIVHFFLPQAYIIGAILARCAGLSRLVMSRRSLNHYQARYPVLGRIERRLHRHMAAVLGNSRRVVSQLHDEERIPAQRLGLIYNGVDLDRFDLDLDLDRGAKRDELGIGADTFCMAIVANLIAYKGHLDLFEALAGVKNDMPEDWVLLAIGRDDGTLNALREAAGALGIGDRVRFLGLRDDVPELFMASDLGLLCSHEEGFSNAILEGMAAGLAMVVTDVGGNAEAVLDGTTGLVVPARAPAALGAAIATIANDPELRHRMGQEARQRAERLFSLEACVSRYEALYEAVACGRELPAACAWQVSDQAPDSGSARPPAA